MLKIKQPYLKGKSVFIVSLIVILVTILTVYLTGINHNRSVTSNFYISLSIIASSLFLFMTYGLYRGIGLQDNFPAFKSFKTGDLISTPEIMPNLPDMDIGDEIGGAILSGILWICMAILFTFLLILLEAVFWVSVFIILAMMYWIFFRALKLVFSKSSTTKGSIIISVGYALTYTVLYIGWIFVIVYLTQIFNPDYQCR